MPGPTRRGQGMDWVPVSGELPIDSSSIKEATNVFRMLDLGSGGLWKAYQSNPGSAASYRVLQCNKHVDCGKLLRIVLNKIEGLFHVEHCGVHTQEVKENPRVNSVLTVSQRHALQGSRRTGGRPAGMYAALTTMMKEELEAQGQVPEEHKHEQGGLKGAT
jgi:hypothetical protein